MVMKLAGGRLRCSVNEEAELTIPSWLEAEIREDHYPWRPLNDAWGLGLADLRFPQEAREEVDALASEARALGLDVSVGQVLLFSADATALIELALFVGGAVGSAYKFIKVINDGPPQLRAFIEKIRGVNRNKDLHPALYLDSVCQWLDQKYGATSWTCDFDAIQVKQRLRNGPTVLALTEDSRNERHLLLVRGDSFAELPVEWASFWDESSPQKTL
jgi:hypothetical protein